MSDRLLDAYEVADGSRARVLGTRRDSRGSDAPPRLGRYRRYDWQAVVDWLEQQRAGQWRKHRPSVPPEAVA